RGLVERHEARAQDRREGDDREQHAQSHQPEDVERRAVAELEDAVHGVTPGEELAGAAPATIHASGASVARTLPESSSRELPLSMRRCETAATAEARSRSARTSITVSGLASNVTSRITRSTLAAPSAAEI